MLINTVTGPIDTAALGPTLMHEHITCADWGMRMNLGNWYLKFDELVEIAAAMFSKAKQECGVTTVVDATPINLGRDVKLIYEVAKRSGVNFIVSSGFYYQEEITLMAPPPEGESGTSPGINLLARPEDEIAELLLNECQNGIADTGIFPGMMKCAVGDAGITPMIRRILSAVARVCAKTGLPVFCHHTVDSKNGGDILDIFESQGVALNRFILGHSGDTDDLAYLEQTLKRGCYLGMDRFAYCAMTAPSLEIRAATIAALCQKGYENKLLISHDNVGYGGFVGNWYDFKNSGPHDDAFTFVHKTALPALLAAGVTRKQFDTMIEDNPRRFFEGI